MNKPIPLTAACPAMADLVEAQGWSLLHCGGDPGYSATAAIQKDGVIFSYNSIKGDRDYDVALALPVHHDLSLELHRPPSLPAVLDDIGLRCVDPEKVFSTAAKNLPRVKSYLSDAAVWDRNVDTAIASFADKYVRWSNGPEITRDLAKSLANRHP